MYQTIALSPLALVQLKDSSRETIRSFFNSLETEKVLYDNKLSILKEYENIKETLADNPRLKFEIEDLLDRIQFTKAQGKEIDCISAPIRTSIKKQQELETEQMLIDKVQVWKIILTNSVTMLKFSIKDVKKETEITSVEHYLSTDESMQICKSKEIINKQKKDSFDLLKWLTKFFRNAKKIEIIDGRLLSVNAKKNLDKLLAIISGIDKSLPVEIVTLSDNANNKKFDKVQKKWVDGDSDHKYIKEIIEDLKSAHNLTNLSLSLIEDRQELNDREIKTDKFQISIGHAIDAIKENNFVRKEFKIKAVSI